MNKEKMIMIKEEYERQLEQDCKSYLCHVAGRLGIEEEFVEYLMKSLNDTMINSYTKDKGAARWYRDDTRSRLVWMDEHIELLGNV